MLVPKGYPQIIIEQYGDVVAVTLIDWPAKPEPIVVPAPEVTFVVPAPEPPSIEPAKINIVAAQPDPPEKTEQEKQKKRRVRTDVNDILKRLVDKLIERDDPPPD
jgi:hypothetical protein